jgi:hypothetical protein
MFYALHHATFDEHTPYTVKRIAFLDVQKPSREPYATRNVAFGAINRPPSFATPPLEQNREYGCKNNDKEEHA